MHAEAARIKMAKRRRRQIIDKRRGGLYNEIVLSALSAALFAVSRRRRGSQPYLRFGARRE